MPENIEALLQALENGDEAQRIDAAQQLGLVEKSSGGVVWALERAAAFDPSKKVQVMALASLAVPVHHEFQRQLIVADIPTRQAILPHIDHWAKEGLITPQVALLLKGRYATKTNAPKPPVAKAVTPPPKPPTLPEPSPSPQVQAAEPEHTLPPHKKEAFNRTFYDGEMAANESPVEVKKPLLEKQKFSLMGTLLSEVTIKIALYLGGFLIVAAAVIFAGLVEPARFPMLTFTIIGFLTAARFTVERLPLGSFALFVIGTLLIPIDAVVLFALVNIDASLLYWAVVTGGISLLWGWGTYLYRSRFLSVLVFVTFSVTVYLVVAPYLAIDSAGLLWVVSLVALAGLAEATLLRRWQGEHFSEPVFLIAQLQAGSMFGILVLILVTQVNALVARITNNVQLRAFDAQEASLLAGWLTLGIFFFASDQLTQHMKKSYLPSFRILVTACAMIPPIFIIEALSADPHQIAAILWGWGVLMVVASEWLFAKPARMTQTYAFLFLSGSVLFLMTAPLVEYITTREYAIGYFLATSVVYLGVAYRRKSPIIWSAALISAYLGYLVGVQTLHADASPVFIGFALLIPALIFFGGELAGRRYFNATSRWTDLPLVLGVFNAVWDIGILISWYNDHPGSAALIFLVYGAFGVAYAMLDNQPQLGQKFLAWTAGLIALYATYINVIPNVNQLEFGGYALLVPALVFLSSELIGKRYFRASPSWTLSLLGLGLFNALLGIGVTFLGGLDNYPGSATLIFLIYGLFGILYAALNVQSERPNAIIAWTVGLIALYIAYAFIYRLPAIERLDIFGGYALLLPMLVFFSGELIGKRRFHLSREWTLPLLGLGVLNAAQVALVTLEGGLGDYSGSAVIIFLISGLFAVLYAALSVQAERQNAIIAWTIALITLYAAYLFAYRLPAIERLHIFMGYLFLIPMLVFFSGELVGRLRFHLSREWILPLFGLGVLNAALVIPITLIGGLENHPGSAVIIFFIGGLFAVLYTALNVQIERQNAIIAWTAGLITLYVAYGFMYRLPAIERLHIFMGYALLLPMLVFLIGELVGKRHFHLSREWTLPLFGLGVLNAGLVVPVALAGGLGDYPGSAVIIFFIGGLLAVLYTALNVQAERQNAVIAWTAGLISLYVAYGFMYRLPAIERLHIFAGYAFLLPMLVFLIGELVGKRHFHLSREWTLPLFGLGVLNAGLVALVTLAGGLENHPGSAALIFLIYGLFGVLYGELTGRYQPQLGYLATISITLALGFALLFYEQDHWVLPFIGLALLYYLGGLAADSYQRHDWGETLHWSGLVLGTAIALSAPFQGGGDAVVGMGIVATIYGAEGFRRGNILFGLPANALFFGAYLLALQELNVTEPQFYSIGTSLMAIVTHYLLYRRNEGKADYGIAFMTGVIAQLILLGTSFIQMSGGLQFFFLLFFESLFLLAYGLVTRSLSFTIVPILFVVAGVLRVVFTVLADYSTVVTLGCTGFALVLLGIIALSMRERLLKIYEEI